MKFLNLYNIIIESRLNDYKLQLKDQQLANNIFSINNPKKEKMIIKWIKNGSIKYPDNIQLIDKAYQIINRKNLDYNKFNSPQQILNQFNQLNQKIDYNPDNQKCFSNRIELGNGVVVYDVQDNEQGQLAVRKAVDFNWGKDSNPWCIIAKNEDGEWKGDYWWKYNKIPKRIAFKNGKLIAFCANNEFEIQWWDRDDKPKSFKQITGVKDDPKAIQIVEQKIKLRINNLTKQYETNNVLLFPDKIQLAQNPNTPIHILQKLSNDLSAIIREYIAQNINCPIEILQKLSNDTNKYVKEKVALNINCPIQILEKLSQDINYNIKEKVALNINCPIQILQKLSNDDYWQIKYSVIENSKCPKQILQKLANDTNKYVKNAAKKKLQEIK